MRRALPLLLFVASLLSPALAETLTGKVVSIADGDTITLLDGSKTQHKIRLYGIDAPERGQDFGERSRQEISGLVFGKEVDVEVVDTDRYKRKVGKVHENGVYVNLVMVARGMAWWYRDYAKSDKDLEQAEARAKKAKRGIWSRADAVAPWVHRKAPAQSSSPAKPVQPPPPAIVREEPRKASYWVTSSSGKTHNSSCRYYKNSKGYESEKGTGNNCKICGGCR